MKTKKTSTEKSAKNSGFRSLLPCAKGYRLPSFLTPIFIVLEVTMEVFIPLLMAAIVDGGLYGSPDFTLRKYFSAELIADKTRFVIILGGIAVACIRYACRTYGCGCKHGFCKEPAPKSF